MLPCAPPVSKRIATIGGPSPGHPASAVRPANVLCSLRLSTFQLGLTQLGGLGWIGSRLQGALFKEVAPALMPVGRALRVLELLQGGLCIRPSLDHLDHAGGLIGADVVAYYYVRSLKFVIGQKYPSFDCPIKALLSEYARIPLLAS